MIGAVPLAVPFSIAEARLDSPEEDAGMKLSNLNSSELDAGWTGDPAPVRRIPIDGEWGAAGGGRTFLCTEPSTGRERAQTPLADPAGLDFAVEATDRAFENGRWRRMPAAGRASTLRKLGDLIAATARVRSILTPKWKTSGYRRVKWKADTCLSTNNMIS